MNKKIISCILSLAILLSAMPLFSAAVFAAPSFIHQHIDHDDCDTVLSDEGGNLSSGCYYLSTDTDLTAPLVIPEGSDVTLCLNGYTLKAATEGSAITVLSGASLKLYDCIGTGKIKEGRGTEGELSPGWESLLGGALYIEENAAVYIYGGTLTENTADYGSAIYNKGTLNISKAAITWNDANENAAIYNAGTAVLYGDIDIKDNHANLGVGGIFNKGKLSLGSDPLATGTDINISCNTGTGYAVSVK